MKSNSWYIRTICYLCFLLLCTSCHSYHRQNVQPDVKFGFMEQSKEGEWILTKETLVIPYGKVFGYDISLEDEKIHDVHDVIFMPSTPKMLTGLLSDNSPQVATTGAKTRPYEVKGRARNIYWFDPGDPIGQYRIDVYVDGKKRHFFKFEVVR